MPPLHREESGALGAEVHGEAHGDGEERDLARGGVAEHREEQGARRDAHLPEAADRGSRHLQGDRADDADHGRVEPAEQGGDVRRGPEMDVGKPRIITTHHPGRTNPCSPARRPSRRRTGSRCTPARSPPPRQEHLRDGDGVGELALGEPAPLLHRQRVDVREHGEAAPEADHAEKEGAAKEFPEAGPDARADAGASMAWPSMRFQYRRSAVATFLKGMKIVHRAQGGWGVGHVLAVSEDPPRLSAEFPGRPGGPVILSSRDAALLRFRFAT